MRYVIRSPKGYYTEMVLKRSTPVEIDGLVVGYRHTYRPKFDGMHTSHASQFNERADAQAMIEDKRFGRKSFANCTIESH
ncbi:MAG: hypothetical protein V4457_05950 [Pseudomonadota bacterium]